MVNRVPTGYRRSSDKLVTANVLDVVDGVAYTQYYLFSQATSGSTIYRLGTAQVFSNDILLSGSSGAATSNILDVDFDLTFNLSKIIKGPVRFNIPYRHAEGGSPLGRVYANVRKVVDGIETDLGSIASEQYDATQNNNVINMEIDLPKTKFDPGDILRVNLVVQASSNPTSKHMVGIDPQNRDEANNVVGTTIDTTTSTVQIPYLLDI